MTSMLPAIRKQSSLEYAITPQGSQGYTGLKRLAKDLARLENEIEINVMARKNFANCMYVKARNFLYKTVLGKNIYSLEQLFDMQLASLCYMNLNAARLNEASRTELERLEAYHDKVNFNLRQNLSSRGMLGGKMERLISDYNALHKNLSSIRIRDSQYFAIEKRLKSVARQLSETKHTYVMNNDTIVDYNNESGSVWNVERLLRLSLYNCERISSKVKRLSEHVANVKKTYVLAEHHRDAAKYLIASIKINNHYI